MPSDAFRNLNNLDPHLNQIVVQRLKFIAAQHGGKVGIDDLTDRDRASIFEEYALSLYEEYRTLRTMFLEGMHRSERQEGLADRKN